MVVPAPGSIFDSREVTRTVPWPAADEKMLRGQLGWSGEPVHFPCGERVQWPAPARGQEPRCRGQNRDPPPSSGRAVHHPGSVANPADGTSLSAEGSGSIGENRACTRWGRHERGRALAQRKRGSGGRRSASRHRSFTGCGHGRVAPSVNMESKRGRGHADLGCSTADPRIRTRVRDINTQHTATRLCPRGRLSSWDLWVGGSRWSRAPASATRQALVR